VDDLWRCCRTERWGKLYKDWIIANGETPGMSFNGMTLGEDVFAGTPGGSGTDQARR
jgi:hypothetical protein